MVGYAIKVEVFVELLPLYLSLDFIQIIDESTREAAIVDPVSPETVAEAIKGENVNLTTVLTTHHHW